MSTSEAHALQAAARRPLSVYMRPRCSHCTSESLRALTSLQELIQAQEQLREQQPLETQRLEQVGFLRKPLATFGEQKEGQRPVGTKLKWILNPETYYVAVITKNGVLQVKSVTDGVGDCQKNFFESESDWRYSLPLYGELTATSR